MRKHELKQLIKEQILAEMEYVSSMKKPWAVKWVKGQGWTYIDDKNNDMFLLWNNADDPLYFEIPLELSSWYSDEYLNSLTKLTPKDIPQFVKQDLPGLVHKSELESVASLLLNIFKSRVTIRSFKILNDYITFSLSKEELKYKGFIQNDK